MKVSPGMPLNLGHTQLILKGSRENLFIDETIGIKNFKIGYREARLSNLGIYEPISGAIALRKAVHIVTGYLKHAELINGRVYRDSRIIVSDHYNSEKVIRALETHKRLLSEPYDKIKGIILSTKRDKVVIFIPSTNDLTIRITFSFYKLRYRTLFHVGRSLVDSVTLTRFKKVTSLLALTNQIDYWHEQEELPPNQKALIKLAYPDICAFFSKKGHPEALTALINHTNEYVDTYVEPYV